MSVWYAHKRERLSDTGKFRQRAQMGATKTIGSKYRGWSYHFVRHQSGASIRRMTYSVSICDPYGNNVEYLTGFSNPERAGNAAQECIDKMLAKMLYNSRRPIAESQ